VKGGAAAAFVALPFAAYAAVLRVVAPPAAPSWAAADPFLNVLPPLAVPALAVVAAIYWRPTRADVRAELPRVALGLAAGLGAVLLLRALSGPTLPSFVPAEEGAAPGLWLNISAGLGEEVVFRLALLPLLWGRLRGGAVLITGLAFAGLHEIGPAPFSAVLFATRFVLPGFGMSVAAVVLRPSFIVAAHLAAHLLLPLLFP
jgi:hypothetical protein